MKRHKRIWDGLRATRDPAQPIPICATYTTSWDNTRRPWKHVTRVSASVRNGATFSSPIASLPCTVLTRRDRWFNGRRRRSWIISYFTMLCMLWPSSRRIQQAWRNSSSGLRASQKRTWDFRSHPTRTHTVVILARHGRGPNELLTLRYELTARKLRQYGWRIRVCGKPPSATRRRRGRKQCEA